MPFPAPDDVGRHGKGPFDHGTGSIQNRRGNVLSLCGQPQIDAHRTRDTSFSPYVTTDHVSIAVCARLRHLPGRHGADSVVRHGGG
ncbi:unnamed protein product [[Actinomadura] parvosata subsp. kistnae]|nr:unnamed protein product [Actinomadura parvosata subsp. kistnae]